MNKTDLMKAMAGAARPVARNILDLVETRVNEIVERLNAITTVNLTVSRDSDAGGEYIQISNNSGMFLEIQRTPNGKYRPLIHLNYKEVDPDYAQVEKRDFFDPCQQHALFNVIFDALPADTKSVISRARKPREP